VNGYAEITLNGCCCEGGGARGLVRAGHYVVGVDTDPSCREGFLRAVDGHGEFICASILDVLDDTGFLERFTFGDFSPPCQRDSVMTRCRPGLAAAYPDLIPLIQPRADALGIPFVIENPDNAATRRKLRDPVTMCMHMFGRPGYRHRLFEAGGGLVLVPPEPSPFVMFTTDGRVNQACGWPHPVATARAGHWEPGMFVSVAGHERKAPVFSVMEIGWMSSRDRVKEAIPPYLGYWIAQQLAAWRAGQEAAA
jgi:DNA (cytosine-5)-methyltransferase 1